MANGALLKGRFMPFDQDAVYSNVDLNDFTDSGIYKVSGNLTHSAGGNNYGCLEVYKFNDNFIIQTFYAVDDARLLKRICNSGTWRKWYAYSGTELT